MTVAVTYAIRIECTHALAHLKYQAAHSLHNHTHTHTDDYTVFHDRRGMPAAAANVDAHTISSSSSNAVSSTEYAINDGFVVLVVGPNLCNANYIYEYR